ncbi:MAG: hypothetical protein DMG81_13945 [Acidobacteria bacterium]|nr:MAG: hypothetical protein DMG81_13945 [Acidobacteriota bacterium]
MNRFQKSMMASLIIGAGALIAQTPSTQTSFVYVESFRKGSTRITEQTLEVDLDPKNPTCEIKVKDQNGRDRYQFRCAPEHPGPGDDRIIAWQVHLADREHKIYGDVLMPSPDPTQDRTQIGWLDPGKFAKIPLITERVVKVDRFYCVFQVTDSHFVAAGQPYLDHLTLDVRFTNTMPHTEVRVKDEKAPS